MVDFREFLYILRKSILWEKDEKSVLWKRSQGKTIKTKFYLAPKMKTSRINHDYLPLDRITNESGQDSSIGGEVGQKNV